MDPIVRNPDLVAYCGLYCGACGSYRKGRCPGCHENTKASWCKARACCREHGLGSCAECTEHPDPATCATFDNFFSKLIGLVLNSDRRAGVLAIRELGKDGFADLMIREGRPALRRHGARART